MVVALLVMLSGTAFTGWLMADETRVAMLPAIVAPAWADGDGAVLGQHGDVEDALEEMHETLANLMLLTRGAECGRGRLDLVPAPREPAPGHGYRRQTHARSR